MATGRPHSSPGEAMRWLWFISALLFAEITPAHAYVSVACGRTSSDPIVCVLAEGPANGNLGALQAQAMANCNNAGIKDCRWFAGYGGACHAISATPDGRISEAFGSNVEEARITAFRACGNKYQVSNCHSVIAFCANEPTPAPAATPSSTSPPSSTESPYEALFSNPAFLRELFIARILNVLETAVGPALAILISIIAFAKRAAIQNLIIHGNLPYKLAQYGEDIEVFFKRTQRLDWYGRVVFGLNVELGMTERQLQLVRRYRLGRVIVFDSLRRQEQNELVRLHMQQVVNVQVGPVKKPSFWRQLWTVIKVILTALFWLLRALISFLVGLLAIRVRIANLIRGTIVESKDLALLLEAKQAIEDSSKYLRDYLLLAETFDGREEIHAPE